MRSIRSYHFRFFFIILAVSIHSTSFSAEDYSDINNALFDSPHMKNIRSPGVLEYAYKSIINTKVIEDKITITVSNIQKNGRTNESFSFFSGDKKRKYPDRENVIGNAVFMYYLEKDVHDLEKKTGGSWRHFQRRIRWAMAAGAAKKEINIDYNGEKITATQYTIQPFANDKDKKRYGSYVNKYYRFILSKDIPGMIYKIVTFVPKTEKWKEGDALLEDESMTFKSFNPTIKQATQSQ